nr:tetratricopeptide repeat protein [Ardenticatenales bacterium]
MNRQEAVAALQENHRNPQAWYTLGRAFAEEGDRAKARESYERALRYAPDFVEARRALAALDAPPLPRWLQEEAQEPPRPSPPPAPVPSTPTDNVPDSDIPDWFENYSSPQASESTLPDIPDWMLEVPSAPAPSVAYARPEPESDPEEELDPEPFLEMPEAALPSWLDGADNEPLLIKPPSTGREYPRRKALTETVKAPEPIKSQATERSTSFWAAVVSAVFLLVCGTIAGLSWLGGDTGAIDQVASLAGLPTRPPTWTAAPPTATSTPRPTPLPTSTASQTDEAYNHPGFGIWWQRPNSGWGFGPSGPAFNGDGIPLVALTSASGAQKMELVVLGLSSEYPPSTLSFVNFLLKVSPYEGLAVIHEDIGIAIPQDADVVEVARNPAVIMGTEDGVGWLIFRPTGIFMLHATGFTSLAEVEPLLSGLLFTHQTLESEARNLEEQRAQLVRAAEQLRELGTKQTVPFAFKDQPTLRQEMLQDMAGMNTEAIKAEEQMLKLLRVIPENMNLLELSLELYSNHIAGFYDPAEATFYLISDDTGNAPLDLETRMVFIHEYTHALQDQHYGLGALGEGQMNHDEAVAYRSLVEGDAQWLTLLYLINNTSMNEIDDLLDLLPSVNTAALAASPYYVRSEFTFPYIEGLAFVQETQLEGGWGSMEAIWASPPRSTEQILHPEQYPADEPTTVTLPEGLPEKIGEGWHEGIRDTSGELGLLLLLQQYNLEFITAEQAAKGWDGDQFLYLTNGERGIYLQEFVWDRSFDSAEAARAFQDWFDFNGMSSEDEHYFVGSGRAGYVLVKKDRLFFAMA